MFDKWIASITLFFQQLAEFQLGDAQQAKPFGKTFGQPVAIPVKQQPIRRR